MQAIRWVSTSIKYGLGVLCWWALFVFLQVQGVFNVGSFVDSLWMKDLHDGLVQNVIGEVAYRAGFGYGDYGSGDKYIYSVLYHPESTDVEGEVRSLSSLVDVPTWRFAEEEGIFAYYLDSRHKYRVRWISDGADISVEDR
jgi:hypothetical protein